MAAYATNTVVGFCDTSNGNIKYIRPGCCQETRRRREKNIATIVMESGDQVASEMSENVVETVELTFTDLHADDETGGAVTLTGFDNFRDFIEDTIGLQQELKYKEVGESFIAAATYTVAQADLTYAEQQSGLYSFKLILRRVTT